MTIVSMRALCADETIMMTEHIVLRCRERRIRYDDIKAAIMSGEIIEDYPNDYPYPSGLVLGRTAHGDALHIVAGIGDDKLWIITAYYPSPDKWETDNRTRKAVEK